ncbi:helix-turn-helix domain-containing protein [Amycolatopsis sp. NPDC051758]|uniref:helix-turn-helix domain-containing protein n=1 Tax=Amycolatopsis sp. NPDC051758 TaxID=3363935 RepID=UPI0037A8D1E8
MTTTSRPIAGDTLRQWRLKAGVTLEAVTAELKARTDLAEADRPSRPTTVSNWETGLRATDLSVVEAFAEVLNLKAKYKLAMVGLWQGAQVSDGFPPRAQWSHNYPRRFRFPEEQAAWVWLRANADVRGELWARLSWGPLYRTFPMPRTAAGLLVQASLSAPNPPLVATFEDSEGHEVAEGGWCAFGSGTVHVDVMSEMGIEYYTAPKLAVERPDPPSLSAPEEFEKPHGSWLQVLRDTADDLDIDYDEAVLRHLGALTPGRPSHQIEESETVLVTPPVQTICDGDGLVDTQLLVEPAQLHLVRRARGMKNRETAAARASTTTFGKLKPITAKMIEHLERTGQRPSPDYSLARLDTTYQADGWLAATRTFDSRTQITQPGKSTRRRGKAPGPRRLHTVAFPAFWVGPIWLQPWHPDPDVEGEVSLEWDGWKREQRVRSRSLLTTRQAFKNSGKLSVTLPVGWHLVAGLGRVPEAGDVNVGWYPASTGKLLSLTGFYISLLGRNIRRVDDDDASVRADEGATRARGRRRSARKQS